jgi:hypothetical protein
LPGKKADGRGIDQRRVIGNSHDINLQGNARG